MIVDTLGVYCRVKPIYFVNQKYGQEEKLNLLKGCLLFRVMIAQYLYTINKHYVFVKFVLIRKYDQ
jgi:hypothetical protein